MGHIGGFRHLYIGQEAVVVGIQSILDKNDTLVTSTGIRHMLACDMDPKGVMAELTGRATGYAVGGRRICLVEKKVFGGHGSTAQVPIAV